MRKRNHCLCVLSLLAFTLQSCSDESTMFSGEAIQIPQGSDAVSGSVAEGMETETGTESETETSSEPGSEMSPEGGTEPGTHSSGGSGSPSSDRTSPQNGSNPSSIVNNSGKPDGIQSSVVKNEGSSTEFGSAAVFRVGDGAADASSCKTEVVSYNLSGAEYSFVFRVDEDATTMNVLVNRLCGIDVIGSNTIRLKNLTTLETIVSNVLPQQVYGPNDVALEPFAQAITLDKGLYSIQVVSNVNPKNNNDRDDFVIGNIRVIANKPVFGTGVQTK